jgi:hypothetical protein
LCDATATLTTPAGWSKVVEVDQSVFLGGYARIVVDILENVTTQSTYTFNGSQSSTWFVVLVVVRPPPSLNRSLIKYTLVETFASSTGTNDNTPDPPSITTTLKNNLIFIAGYVDAQSLNQSLTVPTGYTLVRSSTSGFSGMIVGYKEQLVEGIENPNTFTNADTGSPTLDACVAVTFSLRSTPWPIKVTFADFANRTTNQISEVVVNSAAQSITTYESTTGTANVVVTGGKSSEYQINGGSWIPAGTETPIVIGDSINIRQTSTVVAKGANTSTQSTMYFKSGSSTSSNYFYTLISRRLITLQGATTGISYIVPTSVTSITAIGTGAGGAGAVRGSNSTNSTTLGGGGGGGGALSYTESLAVTPGETLAFFAGQGGVSAGANTYIRRGASAPYANVFLAEGGRAGTAGSTTVAGQGGAGGRASVGIGTVKFSGGKGGNGAISATTLTRQGGGGGGAGGYTGDGGAGANGSTTGTAINGTSGTGGAAAGGGSASGGGGTGVSGAGTSGVGDADGGAPGSDDAFSTGGYNYPSLGGIEGGISGGGGAGGSAGTGSEFGEGIGGDGYIRVTW